MIQSECAFTFEADKDEKYQETLTWQTTAHYNDIH